MNTKSNSESNLYVDNLNAIISRKRKIPEGDIERLFQSFSDRITQNINILRSDLEENISSINDNINRVIKSELSSLKSVTNSIKSDIENICTEVSNLKREFIELKTKQNILDTDVASMKSSLQYCSEEQREISKTVKTLTVKVNDTSISKEQLDILKYEINIMQQRERKQNLEISGLPESKSENLLEKFMKIANHMEINIKATDVLHIHRIQPFKNIPGRPKAVIVKLASVMLRDTMISAARKFRGITTSDIGFLGDARKLFFNEHLTPSNKVLHKKTRETAGLKNYRYVWIRDGKIFCRKDDTSPSHLIRDERDLKKMS